MWKYLNCSRPGMENVVTWFSLSCDLAKAPGFAPSLPGVLCCHGSGGKRHFCSLFEEVKNNTLTCLRFRLYPATNNQFQIKGKKESVVIGFLKYVKIYWKFFFPLGPAFFFSLFINSKFQQYCQDGRNQVCEKYLPMVTDEATAVTSMACKLQMLTGWAFLSSFCQNVYWKQPEEICCTYIICSLQFGPTEENSLISCTDCSI